MPDTVRQAREAMPGPAFVIAVGGCALDGGVFKGSMAIAGGADAGANHRAPIGAG